MLNDFLILGFELSGFGNNDFILQSVPADLGHTDLKGAIEQVLESFKNELPARSVVKQQMIARSMARSAAVKRGSILSREEMESIHNKLMTCNMPELSPFSKPTMFVLPLDDIHKKFKN